MKQFKRIYIEITNICNLGCSFCPKTKRKPEYMDTDTFCHILEQIKPYTDYIYLHVKGEPLLHPLLDQFLDISHEKGLMVNITTNGTIINKVKNKLIDKPALRQINFSLHSFEEKDCIITKTEYIKNILSFTKEAREKSNIIIALRFWNLNENNEINLESKKNNEILTEIEKEFNLIYKIQERITESRGIKLAEGVYLNQDYEFKWPDLKEKEDDGMGFCYGLRSQIAILVDGTVVPCCLDGEGIVDLGNIKKASFAEIIKSERAEHIVKGFSESKAVEELCRKCGYRKRFR